MFTHVRQDTIAGKDVLSRGTPMTAASRYPDIYARWARDPEGFWGEAASAIDWIEKPKKIFDKDAGIYGRWFTGGTCNTCWNAVDRQVAAGRGQQAAIIYDSPVRCSARATSAGSLACRCSATDWAPAPDRGRS